MNQRLATLGPKMNQKLAALGDRSVHQSPDNQSRVAYAKLSIEEMALNAIHDCHSGTIGVEISIKDGRLGKVKRLQVVFQRE